MALVAIVAVIVGGVGGSLKAKKVSTVTPSMVTTTCNRMELIQQPPHRTALLLRSVDHLAEG